MLDDLDVDVVDLGDLEGDGDDDFDDDGEDDDEEEEEEEEATIFKSNPNIPPSPPRLTCILQPG